MQFLQDRAWLIIIVIISLTVFSILIGNILNPFMAKYGHMLYLLIERRLRNKKEIAYKVISDVPILSSQEEARDEVKVLFSSEPISDVRLVVLQIWNSGDINISSNDFVRPIKFNFGKQTKILEAEVIETIPQNIKASLQKGDSDLIVPPLFLKSRDTIKLKLLLTGFKGNIQVDARIVGVGINLIDRSDYIAPQKSLTQSYKEGGKSLIGL